MNYIMSVARQMEKEYLDICRKEAIAYHKSQLRQNNQPNRLKALVNNMICFVKRKNLQSPIQISKEASLHSKQL